MSSGRKPRVGHRVVAIHGFLGLAADWESFTDFEAFDLWPGVLHFANAENAFQAWTDRFNARVGSDRPVLIGYSLGARLAMHAAIAAPEKFSGVVFVSGHPGLTDAKERSARLERDAEWAERFRHEDWKSVVGAWNAQAVLKPAAGSHALDRREADFDREVLALAMTRWSLGRQDDLRSDLRALEIPVLFLTGGDDKKFTSVIEDLGTPERHQVISGAGHRLPWDRPREFFAVVDDFLASLP